MQYFPFEIISVDSALVYRDLNIGTAKPSVSELKRYPHHLIDIIDIEDSYSAKQFEIDAQALIKDIFNRNRLPLLVGGTMLYFKALQFGLNELPEACPETREAINKEAQVHGWAYLHQQLKDIDEAAYQRINPNDSQRIQRALEVYRLTQKPLSAYYQQKEDKPFNFINIAVMPKDRAVLHQRIALRFQQMIEQGLVDEVKSFKDRGLSENKPSMRLVGYRQVMPYLNDEYDKETMVKKGIEATRQLAKRQLTWLRKWPDLHRFNMEDDNLTHLVVDKLKSLL